MIGFLVRTTLVAPKLSAPTILGLNIQGKKTCWHLCVKGLRKKMASWLLVDGKVTVGPSVEVRDLGGVKGKGLFALRPIKAGDVIFEERPLVSCQFLWNATYGYLACDYCMAPLESAEENAKRLVARNDLSLLHPDCCETNKESQVKCAHCQTTYCCEECRSSAWDQFHRTLCLGLNNTDHRHPLELLQEAWRNMHYPPETSNIMLLARIIATVIQAEDNEGAINLFSQFCHRTINEEEEIIHKLLGPQFEVQLETLREYMSKALYSDHCKEWFTPLGFRSLVALVGTNGQGVGTSPLCVWVKNCEDLELEAEEHKQLDEFINHLYEEIEQESGGFLNNEGSALYPLQSSCNHCCVPNAEPNFPYNNFTLVMMAIECIEPGDEVCVSYLDECARNRSRHSRNKILRENYLFTCTCIKCTEQMADDDVTSVDEEDDDDDDGKDQLDDKDDKDNACGESSR